MKAGSVRNPHLFDNMYSYLYFSVTIVILQFLAAAPLCVPSCRPLAALVLRPRIPVDFEIAFLVLTSATVVVSAPRPFFWIGVFSGTRGTLKNFICLDFIGSLFGPRR